MNVNSVIFLNGFFVSHFIFIYVVRYYINIMCVRLLLNCYHFSVFIEFDLCLKLSLRYKTK